MKIRDLLDQADSSHIAIRTETTTLTYAELSRLVETLADALRDCGLREGDRIGIALPNGLEVIAAFLAASTVGTAAPLNPGYTVDEFKFYLEDTRARALIVPSGNAKEARAAAQETGAAIIECITDDRGGLHFSSNEPLPATEEGNSADADIALILHTSGTTSRPKRVPLAHANLLTSARNVANTYQLTCDDVSLCVMPLFHVHGLVASTLAPFRSGGTCV